MPKRPLPATANQLLGVLPTREVRRLQPYLELIAVDPGQVLLGQGEISHVYFPTSAVIAKFVRMEDGDSIEAGIVGKEGMVPLCLFLELDSTPFDALVQNGGETLRMRAKAFHSLVRPGQLVHSVLLRFAAAFMAQVSQAAGCHRLHLLHKRYCRWLLMTHDRTGTDQFMLKQESAAAMLGVRRMSITPVAQKLEKAGLIHYSRGRVTILNRPGLEAASCECYSRITSYYDNLLKGPLLL